MFLHIISVTFYLFPPPWGCLHLLVCVVVSEANARERDKERYRERERERKRQREREREGAKPFMSAHWVRDFLSFHLSTAVH